MACSGNCNCNCDPAPEVQDIACEVGGSFCYEGSCAVLGYCTAHMPDSSVIDELVNFIQVNITGKGDDRTFNFAEEELDSPATVRMLLDYAKYQQSIINNHADVFDRIIENVERLTASANEIIAGIYAKQAEHSEEISRLDNNSDILLSLIEILGLYGSPGVEQAQSEVKDFSTKTLDDDVLIGDIGDVISSLFGKNAKVTFISVQDQD